MSKDRNKRVEREIAEILERTDSERAPTPTPGRRYRPSRSKLNVRVPSGLFNRVPPGIAWLGGIFGFALLAIFVSDFSSTLAIIFALLSIAVLLSPLVLWSRKRPLQQGKKEWRGRVIELPPRDEGVIGRIKYKWWEFRNRSR